jgi:hypothetical protein
MYNLSAQVVPVENDVFFDTNGPISGFTHPAGANVILVTAAGVYSVTFSVSGAGANQFTLTDQGSPVLGATYGSGAGTQQNTGTVIVALGAGDFVTLRNHTSAGSVTLQTTAGGTQTNVNASLLFVRLQ